MALSARTKLVIKEGLNDNIGGTELIEAVDAAINTGLVVDAINNGVTTSAPSQNAVYDALALKADATSLANYILASKLSHATSAAATGVVSVPGLFANGVVIAIPQASIGAGIALGYVDVGVDGFVLKGVTIADNSIVPICEIDIAYLVVSYGTAE